MLFDIISRLICPFIAVFIIYWYDEHVRVKCWKWEKDTWQSLLVDAQMEIKRLSGGDTELTREIEDILRK